MIVIGCDFGLRKSGIVVLDENNNILEQALIRVNSIGAQRLFEIEQSFDKLLSRLPSDEKTQIFIEGYAYGAKYQRESLAELGGVMRRYFYVNNLNFWVIPPTSVKTFVTGTGRASKNYMKKRTKEKWGHTFRSDDVCDAHGLARLGVAAMKSADLGVPVGTEESELAVLKDMLIHRDHYENGNTAKRSKKPTRRTRQKATNDTSKTTTKG